jgi:putative membrane protein
MIGSVHLDVVIGVALAAGAYVGAWRAAGQRVHRARAVAFAGALVTLLVAVNGPLHDLAESALFSAHMVQHLLLTLVVPPLLLAGMPTFMIDTLLAPGLARPAFRAVLGTLTRPVPALAVYTLVLVMWHLPGPYDAALRSHAIHIAEHAMLVAAALLAWWPVVSTSRRLPPLPYAAQILYLFAFGMPMTIVAAMITGAEHALYPFYAAAPMTTDLTALADQRLGGVLMWVPAGVIPLAAFTAVFFRWAAAESED